MTAIGLDVANLSLVDAADAVRQGEVSAVALLEACLANFDAHEDAVNATIWVDKEGAFVAARAADTKRAAGGPIGPLHGLPLAHKDMYYQAGRLSTCGSAIRRDFVPDYSATVIERLAAAGAYAFAGLNMAEFAQNGTGHNRHAPFEN
jgi:aspartyl-tRNA(Asn)/glutamyl-tRNA(Gln) amidotransferase subunit A